MKAKIVLIRHGMTQGNQEHRYVGTTDEGMLPESVEELGDGRRFRLEFNCAECQMNVYSTK